VNIDIGCVSKGNPCGTSVIVFWTERSVNLNMKVFLQAILVEC
jgi:hypothetical protein